MTKQTEAMKLALEALEWDSDYDKRQTARAALREALAEQPAQHKYRRGDRLICLETEEYCVIHISGTDRQWVKFPDTHIGVYKNEQLAELFELLPKEIESEQPAQQEPVDLVDGEGNPLTLMQAIDHAIPLYTSPPAQRTWVGLTDEEIEKLREKTFSTGNPYCPVDSKSMRKAARAIEAKLKAKNSP